VLSGSIAVAVAAVMLWIAPSTQAQNASFHNAPASAAAVKNPLEGQATAVAAGKKLFGQNCAQCHGNNLQGMGPAPALDNASTKNAKPGELFWFITTGNVNNGMPSWSQLPKQQRWQIVTFLESKIKGSGASAQ
jgi:mono/diheme cytochrome c family protein